MARSSQKTRKRILDAAYKLFRRRGFARVSMDDIADNAKLTKRTVYNHFESKDELLTEVLDAQHHLDFESFQSFADRLPGSAEDVVESMFHDLSVWADTPRWAGSGFTRFVIELADLPGHPARLIARRHKALLERCFSDLLAKRGIENPSALARSIWSLSEGAISLRLIHGDRGYSVAASETAVILVRHHLNQQANSPAEHSP